MGIRFTHCSFRAAIIAIAATITSNASSFAQSLDLNSTARTAPAAALPANGVSVLVNGRPMHVAPSSTLTPAQQIAVQQVVSMGRQSLVLGADARAIGGTFLLNNANADVLLIPHGVTAIQNAASVQNLFVQGNFLNAGRYYAVSNDPARMLASISALSITNLPGALLTSVLPAGGLPGVSNPLHAVDLSLTARGEQGIMNASGGTISSSRDLNLYASNIVNNGSISAARDLNFRGTGATSISGVGTVTAPNINLYGDVTAKFGEVTGKLNTFGTYAHVGTSTGTLHLGEIKLDGDPTYYNDAGDIDITGNISVGEALTIIASKNINIDTNTVQSIVARDQNGQGYDLTLVAGANVTSGAGVTTGMSGTPPIANNATAAVTIDGPSATGGDINIPAIPAKGVLLDASSTCTGCAAGNVVLAAYSGGGTGGHINMPGGGSLANAPFDGTGSGGIVVMLAGADSGVAIASADIQASRGGGVVAVASQPTTSDGAPITFNTDGSVGSNNSFVAGSSLTNGAINLSDVFAGGSISIISGGPISVSGMTAQDITATTTTSLTLNGGTLHVSASNSLQFNAPIITATKTTQISAPHTFIANLIGPLTLALNGSDVFATSGAQISANGPLTFAQNVAFVGPVNLYSSDSATGVSVPAGVLVTSNQDIEITSPSLTLAGNLVSTGLHWSNPQAASAGTILNPAGDVVIPANLTYAGQNLAILAQRNILAAPGVTSINLSSATGHGGSLLMLAGFDFSEKNNPSPPTASNTAVPNLSLIVSKASPEGGSILLGGVKINTGSTSKDTLHRSAGEIFAVAAAGTQESGLISLGALSAKSTYGTGGIIRLMGGGGVHVASITNSSANGAQVRIDAKNPLIIGGELDITDGVMTGPGQFVASGFSQNFSADVNVRSGITTKGTVTNGGELSINADGPITVKGLVDTTGTRQRDFSDLNSTTGGGVSLISALDTITVGGITTRALTALPGTSSQTIPGSAGAAIVISGNGVNILGSLIADGAPNALKDGFGGAGGFVVLLGGSSGDDINPGAVRVKGYISAQGGSARLGVGGPGGHLEIKGQTVSVLGSLGGNSINTSYGAGPDTLGFGTVEITTNATQPIPVNFDLTSSKRTIALSPGAAFSVGTANPVNGTAGNIMAQRGSVVLTKRVAGSTGFVTQPGYFSGGVKIRLVGSPLIPPLIGNTRSLGTPLEALNVFQIQHGETPAINSGTITVYEPYLPARFSAFNLPSGYTLTVQGINPKLEFPATAKFGGDIAFVPIAGGGTMLLDFGTGSGNIPASTHITSPTNTELVILTRSSQFNNSGTIAAPLVTLARVSSAPLTFNQIGASAHLTANALLLSQKTSPTIAFNFKANGSNFEAPVVAATTGIPAKYSAISDYYEANVSKPTNMKLSFALTDAASAPITAHLTGGISLGSASVTASSPLHFDDNAFWVAQTDIKISTTSALSFGDHVTLAGKRDVALTGDSVSFGSSDRMWAGLLSPHDPLRGLVAPGDIISAGALTVTAKGAGGIKFLGTATFLDSTAKDVVASATTGDIDLGQSNILRASGGRVIVAAKGTVTGLQTGLWARAIDKPTSTAGGVYVGSGVAAPSVGVAALNAAFAKEPGVVGGFNPTGISVVNPSGVFWVRESKGGTVRLTGAGGDSDILMTRGVMVLDAVGAGASVDLQHSILITEAVKPVATTAMVAEPEFVVDTEQDL